MSIVKKWNHKKILIFMHNVMIQLTKLFFLLRQREDQKGLSVRELIANDLLMPISFEISANRLMV